ncbi:hypothetical protein M3O75_18370 [Klebsiella pneumoniae]|nr:hypothetical protein [Klebsiella pneumoniae]
MKDNINTLKDTFLTDGYAGAGNENACNLNISRSAKEHLWVAWAFTSVFVPDILTSQLPLRFCTRKPLVLQHRGFRL